MTPLITGDLLLQLTASDSAATRADTVAVTVQPADDGGTRTIEVRVAAGSDDAEQVVSGSTFLSSSDLELTTDGSTQQAVVNRTGWVDGNAVALQFSGTGRRTAEAFEGSATGAPLLHVEYTTGTSVG